MKKLLLSFLCATLLSGTAYRAAAGDATDKSVTLNEPLPLFHAGQKEVEVRAGAMFSVLGNDLKRPIINYATETARFGWMLTDVKYSGVLRGNYEFLLEVFGDEVFKGPGNGMVGGQIMFRYNFVQPGARLIPYLELGGGGLYNDIYKDQVQHRIGEGFEFVLHGGAGVRWMMTDHWGLSLEGDFRHISNAGLASRNTGLNSVGATFGVNYLF